MYFEWVLIVAVHWGGSEAIPMALKTFDNSLECESAVELIERVGGQAYCYEQQSDKHPM